MTDRKRLEAKIDALVNRAVWCQREAEKAEDRPITRGYFLKAYVDYIGEAEFYRRLLCSSLV